MAPIACLLGAAILVAAGGCSAQTAAPPCSLNGELASNGHCACDKPWTGPNCSTMLFKPVSFPQGYGMYPRPWTVWGGNVLFDGAQFHIFASSMTNGCPLRDWGKNSRIDHAVADKLEGPYTFKDVAVPTWAHNAAPIRLPDGSFAIVHIGDGSGSPSGGANCTTAGVSGAAAGRTPTFATFQQGRAGLLQAPPVANRAQVDGRAAAGGSTIHVSKSLAGPWEPLTPNTLGRCNNPAPWVHPNGTLYCVCGGGLKRAASISGPWTTVSTFTHSGGPAGNYEDPFLYTDHRGWHLLYHVYNTHENPPHGHECLNATVSAHAYSTDGFTWFTSPLSPYGTQVELTNGTTITVSTRERPKLFFNASGHKTHLLNGVCSAPTCPDGPPTGCVDCKYGNWDYTLIQPLDV